MQGESFFIEKISTDGREVTAELDKFKSMAGKFASYFKILIHLNVLTCKDVIHLYSREMKKLKLDHPRGPNIYKQTAAMASWIMRLKPIFNLQFEEGNRIFPDNNRKDFARRHINEIFAMFYCFALIRKARPHIAALQNTICNRTFPGLPEFDEFLSNLRFRFLGVRQLATLLQLCCENSLPNDHPTQKTGV